MRHLTFLNLLLLMLTAGEVMAQSDSTYYRLVRKIQLPGGNGWDYLTVAEPSGRLYISHGNTVQVVDVKEGKMIGEIANQNGVHGIAIAEDLNKGYISNGRDSTVTIFELKSLKILGRMNVNARNPDAILYDPFSHNIFTFNGGSSNATVIDARTDQISGMIPLGGKPEFAVTNRKGKIYVNIEDKSKVAVIDPVAMKVENEWSLSPGQEPSGLAFDAVHEILFSVCDNNLMIVMDANSGKILQNLPIGSRVDGAAFDPGLRRVFSSNGDGTLTVVQEIKSGTYRISENAVTQKGARTIALDPVTHHIFLPTAEYDKQESSGGNAKQRPSIKPGTFVVLEMEPVK